MAEENNEEVLDKKAAKAKAKMEKKAAKAEKKKKSGDADDACDS